MGIDCDACAAIGPAAKSGTGPSVTLPVGGGPDGQFDTVIVVPLLVTVHPAGAFTVTGTEPEYGI